jgi:hypothetical protein
MGIEKKFKYKLERNAKIWKSPIRLRRKWFNKSYFLQTIEMELKAGHSVVILIVGRTRLGKTWLGLTMASLFSDKFIDNPVRWVGFEQYARDILGEITTSGYSNLKQDVYILDECGRDLDYRVYASGFNRLFSHIFQTQQIMGKIFILILPDASLLAKAHHKLINYTMWKVTRDLTITYKIVSHPADITGKDIYNKKVETVLNFPLPHPKIIEWFDKIEKPQKREIAQELLDNLNKIKANQEIAGQGKPRKEFAEYKSIFSGDEKEVIKW